jgi:RNA polymerase sigma factor (sigma-70 family)
VPACSYVFPRQLRFAAAFSAPSGPFQWPLPLTPPSYNGLSGAPVPGAPRPQQADRASHHDRCTIPSEYLLHRVSTGDSAAVKELIARFGGLVWSLARRLGLPDSETEDAVHEVFTELCRNGARYDPTIASETAFVATIARRRLIDRRRKVGRQPLKTQITESEPARGTDGEARPEVGEEAAIAAKAFEQLSAEQQRVLRLSVYEGLSHELIARSTGLPLGTVKTHARRGLIRLREMLNKDRAAPSPENSGATSGQAPGRRDDSAVSPPSLPMNTPAPKEAGA